MTVQRLASFALPPDAEARVPPEERGLARDEVRMLVARPGRIEHLRVRNLPDALHPGDLLVVNTSATVPAAVPLRGDRRGETVHVSSQLDSGEWVVEVRARQNTGPGRTTRGDVLSLPGGLHLTVVDPHPEGQSRLWRTAPDVPTGTLPYLSRHGRPIGYRYLDHPVPLSALQTVYAREPGSAEMPSAGRPFTAELITALAARAVLIAPLILHTGVSSLERGEAPYPERYAVPEASARLVNAVRWWGGRVIAVGTTCVRALETVAAEDGTVVAGEGWTRLVVTPERGLHAVDGLITGWHEPEASHLQLLEAVAGPELLAASYAEALGHGYLWHEFGDSHLILP